MNDKLKLLALDESDLTILSAHLQDAVLRIGDMTYLPGERRFAATLSRFDWIGAQAGQGGGRRRSYQRRRALLRIERVLSAQVQKLSLAQENRALELLAMTFAPVNPPGGFITLVFAGGAAVRLKVECIEAELRDLDAVWQARSRPAHDVE